MHAASVLPRSAAEAPEVLPRHTLDRSQYPQYILELSQEQETISVCFGNADVVTDSFSLFEGVEEPRVPLHPWAGSTKGLSNHS